METVKSILEAKGSEVFSVGPDATLYEALEVMTEKNVGAVLVIDSSGAVKGTRVREIMTTRVLYVSPATTLADCMNLMTEKRVRHLPVLLDGKPVGIVSIGDVVKAMLKSQERVISEQASEIGQLERYISGCV